MKRFRAINVNTSYPTAEEAYKSLIAAMHDAANSHDDSFHQGDERGAAVDFFEPVVDDSRFHPAFRLLLEDRRYSAAREIIKAMMRYHNDVDGNFVQKFQTAGWDALLWELYLFATFTELGFVRVGEAPTPDFVFQGNEGGLAIEATSVNPSMTELAKVPSDPEAFKAYLENYIPIRLSAALRGKLNHKPSYWEQPSVKDLPFCIAVQDFHISGGMRFIVHAATEYVFGVRHWNEEGVRKIERIRMHRYGKKRAQSGFFDLDKAENVSAVIINPQGTVAKFNRLGVIAGFGDPEVKLLRIGYQRNDGNIDSPYPTRFKEIVGPNSKEKWVEGMVVLHNPKAKIPLNPDIIPGACHEFLQPDGSIMSLLPSFHPLFSQTYMMLEESQSGNPDCR